jgi:uncharacterized membrane protein YphA (DoxX/SURF4 family)
LGPKNVAASSWGVAEFIGAILLIPGIYTRWVCLYTLPLIAGAVQFWAARKGFFFTGAGCELAIAWSIMLVTQVLLGDGPFSAVASVTAKRGPREIVAKTGRLTRVAG